MKKNTNHHQDIDDKNHLKRRLIFRIDQDCTGFFPLYNKYEECIDWKDIFLKINRNLLKN